MNSLNFPKNLLEIIQGFDVSDYESPENERSYYKDIPIEYIDHPVIVQLMADYKLKAVYRGSSTSSFKRPQSYMPRAHAQRFALYQR